MDVDGERIEDPETLKRLRGLTIPPAWKDVWICPDEWGHLQAVGLDSKGRRQYLYHQKWSERRDQEKFDRMLRFAQLLTKMRERCETHLREEGMSREKVLACAVRLLDCGFFRIGSERYADENDTFGIATIRKDHVKVGGDEIVFDFNSKGGKRQITAICNEPICEVVTMLKRRSGGGDELFAYKDRNRWVDVRSSDVTDFIKETMGDEFSAKDFRTWTATVLASVTLAVSSHAESKTARDRVIRHAVKEVASHLNDTPAVTRNSYIDPRIFDRYRSGWTIAPTLERLGETGYGNLAIQGTIEEAVIDLIEDDRTSDRIEEAA